MLGVLASWMGDRHSDPGDGCLKSDAVNSFAVTLISASEMERESKRILFASVPHVRAGFCGAGA